MGLREIFDSVTNTFNRERIEYAVIGAFALYGFGHVRATRDIDFVTRLANQDRIRLFLEGLGFETTHCSTAFSNHVHPVGSVRVDMMYVDGTTADEIFSAVRNREIFKGADVPVVSAEHLIAMKLFAASSNPERKFKDLGDVKEIICNVNVDREFVKKYFYKYRLVAYYEEIAGK
jgi:hypothetical protein